MSRRVAQSDFGDPLKAPSHKTRLSAHLLQGEDLDDGYAGSFIHAANRCRGACVNLTEQQALAAASASTLLQREDFDDSYAHRVVHAADDGGILRSTCG